MQLISLNISGFKSFANDTAIQFAPGVTGVVGPNGCGKSNVVDALRWVLGEQRSSVLRGERMENVIFNGTVRRKPLNMAEVRVKFDNSSGRINLPYTEIEIARRLHRDGTSEYLLNNNSCRLRDITDMLQDSGLGPNAYTILELKMIEDILREEGEGRRQLFEEASGIAKYKLRRRQALAKLTQTEEDLLRLADIITEVERQVASLKRQVSKARRYQELNAELKKIETAFVVTEYFRLVADVTPMRQALGDATSQAEDSVSNLRRFEAEVEKLRTEQVESDQQLSALRQALQDTVAAISVLEADKAGCEARLAAARDSLDRAQRQVILANDKLSSIAGRTVGLSNDVAQSDEELRKTAARRDDASQRLEISMAALKDMELAYRETDARLAGLNKSRAELETERARHLEGIARQKGRRESAHHSRDQVLGERADLQNQVAVRRSELQHAEQDLERAEAAHAVLESKGAEIADQIADLQQRVTELDRIEHATQSHIALLRTLESRGPRAAAPLKFLAERFPGSQLVADSVVVEQSYRKAVQAALGEIAYHIVIEDRDTLMNAMEALRSRDVGRCGYLLRQVALDEDVPSAPDGSLGWADDYVKLSGEIDSLRPLLRRCVVVKSFEDALWLLPFLQAHRVRAVSLSGDWLDWTGACNAGSDSADAPSDLGLAHQIETLQQTFVSAQRDKSELQAELAGTVRKQEDWKSELGRLANDREQSRRTCDRQRSEVLRMDTLMHSLKQREEAALQLIMESEEAEKKLRDEVERMLGALEDSRADILTTQKEVEALSERVWQARQENTSAREFYHEAARVADSARHRRELLDAEAERLRTTEAEQQEAIRANSELAESAANTIRESESALREIAGKVGELFRERDARYRAVDEAQRGKDAARGEVHAMEEQLKKLRSSRELAYDNQRNLEVAIAKLEGELESHALSAKTQYGIELDQASLPANLAELRSLDASQELIQELRTKIENLGSVNLLAVDEFEAETKRLDGMLANRSDLLQAKTTLEETIRKINETAEAKFLHTFEAVRANFQSLFTEFFPAGEADLILSGKDLLEADITMWANPSGKRLKSLTLMSGGEKTMTAIALLFSLYQVKPSPFCVLDEVDAPLDDANIDRFTRMIHRHSDHTQFIMITHNKRTMEVADNLYGVTMQEEGVSKMVSVRLLRPAETQPARAAEAAAS